MMKLTTGIPKEGPYWIRGRGSPDHQTLSVPLQTQPRSPWGVITSHHW